VPVTTSPIILGTLGLAVIAVTVLWRYFWPVIELSAEGTFRAVLLLTRAGFRGAVVWVRRDTHRLAAVTFNDDYGWWLSRFIAALIAVPTPSLLGLLLARGVQVGWHPATVLAVLLILFGLLVFLHRNWYALLLITGVALTLAVLIWLASPLVQLGAVIALAWFFLLGGLRYAIEWSGFKHTDETGSPPGLLQRLTDIPGVIWMLGFLFIAIAAAIAGARWLLTCY
jgi:Peptidase M50B-like